MPKFNKPTPSKINTIWATNAVTGDVTEIDTSKIQQGWIQEKPPYQSENWINQQHDQYIAYINQLGVPEWDQYTEYQSGKSYVQASNNLIYKCIQTHVNKNPATAGNEAFWNVWEGNRQATTTQRGTTSYATNSQAQGAAADNVALTPSNLLSVYSSFFGSESSGSLQIPTNSSGSKKTFVLQWGYVDYLDIVNVLTLTVNFHTTISEKIYCSGIVDTSQTGVTVNTRDFSNTSVKFDLKEPDTTVIGGRLRWIAIGVK